MRLLVTRPEPDARATAELLRALGHSVVVEPLLRTELLPLQTTADPAAIAVTSRNGVRALAPWQESDRWRTRPVFAVGAATKAAATEAGFTDVRSADGDGATLARLVMETLAPSAGTILYPAAEERSPAFELALREGGYAIETVIAYRMIPSEALSGETTRALRSRTIDGVLLYSQRTATTFVSLVDSAGLAGSLHGIRMFVLSDNVASVLRGRQLGGIEVAARPSEDALLNLIPAAC